MPYVVVAYDTPSNARRTRLRERLKGALFHSQESVFEGSIRGRDVRRLHSALRSTVSKKEDRLALFLLCRSCAAQTERLAGSDPASLPLVLVVGEGR